MIVCGRVARSLTLAASLFVMAGCASSTPYQPQSMLSPVSGGYSDQRLGPDRYNVTFVGNTFTTRERVEDYLLFRAAELTRERGADWFVMVTRESAEDSAIIVREDRLPTVAERDGLPLKPLYAGWHPYWRYQDVDYRWRDWDPYSDDQFWADEVEPSQVESFQANAEIRLGRGPIPIAEPDAIEARRIIAEIGPHIKYPED